jgi:hypothetical protein
MRKVFHPCPRCERLVYTRGESPAGDICECSLFHVVDRDGDHEDHIYAGDSMLASQRYVVKHQMEETAVDNPVYLVVDGVEHTVYGEYEISLSVEKDVE